MWFYARDKQKHGPVSWEQLRAAAIAFTPDERHFLVACQDSLVSKHAVPIPSRGDDTQLLLRTRVLTRCEVDAHGELRVLGPREWEKARAQLEHLD